MITQASLKQILRYDPAIGLSFWLEKRRKVRVGEVVGYLNSEGYRWVEIDGKAYKHARLVWLYMTGKFPQNLVEHKDLNKWNDKWSNLREATRSQNVANTKKNSRNTSGFKGVTDQKQGFVARIGVDNRRLYLGTFKTREEAAAAYAAAARQHFGEFARIG